MKQSMRRELTTSSSASESYDVALGSVHPSSFLQEVNEMRMAVRASNNNELSFFIVKS